jgi:hypothetical protein
MTEGFCFLSTVYTSKRDIIDKDRKDSLYKNKTVTLICLQYILMTFNTVIFYLRAKPAF